MSTQNQPVIRSLQFRKEREPSWIELEFLLEQAHTRGLEGLEAEDLAKLPQLHRAALTSLGVARTISADRNLLAYLESLCARAHIVLHGPRQGLWGALRQGALWDVPLAIVGLRVHLLLSAALLLLGMAIAYVMVGQEPLLFGTFVEEAYAGGRGFDSSAQELRAILFQGETGSGDLSRFASFLMTHNARIGLVCAMLGVACGVPVFYLMLKNGFVLGAFAQLHVSKGLGLEFLSWILPHGIPELGAIVLCGAIGLALAQAVIFPGAQTRFENVVHRGQALAPALAGAVVLFFFAGLIEGFFRQMVHDMVARFVVAALMAALLGLVWSQGMAAERAGRGTTNPPRWS